VTHISPDPVPATWSGRDGAADVAAHLADARDRAQPRPRPGGEAVPFSGSEVLGAASQRTMQRAGPRTNGRSAGPRKRHQREPDKEEARER